MATTEVQKAPAAAPPPTKPGRGRPKKEPQPQTTKTGEEGIDFFSYLKSFSEQEWGEFLFMYLYRRMPITDRKLTGNDIYIAKYVKAVEIEDIMQEHGSGEYKLMLNRYDPATRKNARLSLYVFRVLNEKYPPKIPYGEWVDDDRNRDWLWAKPALLQKLHDNQTAAAGIAPAIPTGGFNDPAKFMEAVFSVVQKIDPSRDRRDQAQLAERVVQAMQDTHKEMLAAASPQKQLELVSTIVNALKGGGDNKGDTALMTLLSSQLTEAQKFNRELLTKLMTKDDTPRKSVRQELSEIVEIAEMLGDRRSNGSTGWDVAKEVGIKFLEIAGTVGTAIAMRHGLPTGKRPAVNVTGQLEPAADRPPTEEEKAEMLRGLNQAYGPMLDEVAPHIVDKFLREDGYAFRDWFIDEYGNRAYGAIAAMDTRTIMELFAIRLQQAADPIKADLAKLTPLDAVESFIEQFKSDDDPDEESEKQPGKPEVVTPIHPANGPAIPRKEF
jgi:hypothetical protein